LTDVTEIHQSITMVIVTVGPKYQIVIPKSVREKVKGIKSGSKVGICAESEDTIVIKINPKVG